jgi:hypothetical protein
VHVGKSAAVGGHKKECPPRSQILNSARKRG